jgi:hypothetical protein
MKQLQYTERTVFKLHIGEFSQISSPRHDFVFIVATITDDILSVQLAIMEVTDKESDCFYILLLYSIFNNGLPNTREC